MFEKINEKITSKIEEIGELVKENIKAQSTPFNAGEFGSEVAEKTKWTPLKPGGSNTRTHTYIEIEGEVHFKATKGMILFFSIFMLVGLVVPVYAFVQSYSLNNLSNPIDMVINLIPLIFFIIGFILMRIFTKPIVFSKQSGYFWKGRLGKEETPEYKPLKDYCRLADIEALQIIGELVRSSSSGSSSSNSSSYRSYEINLVLKDGNRLNVIDHGRKINILDDAKKLADFLQVPLWDKSGRF